jgi:tetrahydromethanopterin S-methyltransferase subunit F
MNALNIKSVKVLPESVDPENSYEIQVVANPQLNSVQVIVNDVLTTLEETKD